MPHITIDSGWVKAGLSMFAMLLAGFISYNATVTELHLVEQAVQTNAKSIESIKDTVHDNTSRITETERNTAVIMALLARMDKKLDKLTDTVDQIRRGRNGYAQK